MVFEKDKLVHSAQAKWENFCNTPYCATWCSPDTGGNIKQTHPQGLPSSKNVIDIYDVKHGYNNTILYFLSFYKIKSNKWK